MEKGNIGRFILLMNYLGGTVPVLSKTNAEARACYFTHSFVTLQANSFLTWEVVGS